jgi:DNA-binding GntR family transcriptional regulator
MNKYYLRFYKDVSCRTDVQYNSIEDVIQEHYEIIEAIERGDRTFFLKRSITPYIKDGNIII